MAQVTSGHDLRVLGWSPVLSTEFSAQQGVCFSLSLCPLPPCPTSAFSLSPISKSKEGRKERKEGRKREGKEGRREEGRGRKEEGRSVLKSLGKEGKDQTKCYLC